MGKVWNFKQYRRRLWQLQMQGQTKGCIRWKPDGITDNREEMVPHIRRAKELRLMREMWVYLPENCNAKAIQL